MGDTPSGLLRITAPSALAVTLLGDLIGRYCQQHPRVRVLLDTRDQIIDLVGEGYDLAFRAQGASLTDSRLVARELAPVPLVLVAAPDRARRRPRDRPRCRCWPMPRRTACRTGNSAILRASGSRWSSRPAA